MTDPLETQRQLQADADEVVRQLDLAQLLGTIGRPIRVGSSAMGLMVRRDIDITIVCPKLDATTLEAFSEVGAHLMRVASVGSVRFRNDCGVWNKEPDKYPDGLYLGVTVTAPNEATWTLDIWAIDEPGRQPDLAHLEQVLPRIADEHRIAILQIKRILADREKGLDRIPSALVYEAVVDHAVRTADQFDGWFTARGN
jgi:hypothetical protein